MWRRQWDQAGHNRIAIPGVTDQAVHRKFRGQSAPGRVSRSLRSSTRGAFLMDPQGGDVAFVGPDDKPLLRWEPHQNWDWPLQVGKTFTRDYRLIVGADRTIPYTRTCSVKSVEDVSVPAGTFKAWKVECSDTLGVEDVLWFSPELGIFVKLKQQALGSQPIWRRDTGDGAGFSDSQEVGTRLRRNWRRDWVPRWTWTYRQPSPQLERQTMLHSSRPVPEPASHQGMVFYVGFTAGTSTGPPAAVGRARQPIR